MPRWPPLPLDWWRPPPPRPPPHRPHRRPATSASSSRARPTPSPPSWRWPSSSGRRPPPQPRRTTPPVGTVRPWIGLDTVNQRLYLKDFTLKAVGNKIEVWVASDTDSVSTGTRFPDGDCRNAVPGSTTITTRQAQDLAREFDTTIHPRESAAFSVPPDRDGTNALVGGDYTGAGDKIVTLVDNVRDENFYTFPENPTYIAGFFSSQFNELLDRNVMTIDAYDWKHRTGANPPDQPTGDPCTSRPGRPFLYEGVFAHEYQHLLQYYQDPNEVNFINEGLSDFAISLTGYGSPEKTIFQRGADSHITCFQGFGVVRTRFNPNPRDCGGPQNSLTLWGDEGDGAEILSDYGNAWSFQQYLFDRYGQRFISALHRDGAHQGLGGVQAALNRFGNRADVFDVLHDFQTMNLLDRAIGVPSGTVTGRPKSAVTTPSLRQALNLDNPAAYAKPGAAPNGADYVSLQGVSAPLTGSQLKEVTFRGATTLPPLSLRWSVVRDAPGRAGNPTLWSGNESNLDAAAITSVAVPTANPTLTYTEKHLAEEGYDYAYTVVSTDGGRTYTPLANANTVRGPLGPALNGDAGSFVTQRFDLSAYAGQTVLLGFRYVSDGGVNDGGWYVDDVRVGGTTVSNGSTLAPFRSPSQVRPTEVANWHVRLVGLDAAGHRAHVAVLDARNRFRLDAQQLAAFRGFPTVVATVAYDDPTEQVQQYAPYTLTVNGVVQPGG